MKPLRPISVTALEIVEHFEGYSPVLYTCPAGKPTIGYGHVVPKHDLPDFQKPITKEKARQILMMDMTYAQQAVDRLVKVPLTQNQYDALVSFVFNVGETAFAKSTLLRQLNKRRYQEAAVEFMRWIHADGKPLNGLIRRRRAEQELFLRESKPLAPLPTS
jgi:GH24 family phage-related lysozyme (muramidase)